jgi:hypothetical protein
MGDLKEMGNHLEDRLSRYQENDILMKYIGYHVINCRHNRRNLVNYCSQFNDTDYNYNFT